MSLKTRNRSVADAPPGPLLPTNLTVVKPDAGQHELGDDYGTVKPSPKQSQPSVTPALIEGLTQAAAQLGDCLLYTSRCV